jgi:hypothetical protein
VATITIEADQLKSLIRDAVLEAWQAHRAEVEEVVDERLGDIGLLRAMDEVDPSKTAPLDEVIAFLDAKP